jgi:hypothetical protein
VIPGLLLFPVVGVGAGGAEFDASCQIWPPGATQAGHMGFPMTTVGVGAVGAAEGAPAFNLNYALLLW